MFAYIQRQVQAQHITLLVQRLQVHILGAVLQLRAQAVPVVVADAHPKGAGLGRHVAPDAAHAQDAEDLALRVVAQPGERRAAPLALAQGLDADGQVAQGAEQQPDGDVGRGVVDGGGGV